MAEFGKVVQQSMRRCKACDDGKEVGCTVDVCFCKMFNLLPNDTNWENFEREIMAWAAEHPEPQYPTWYEWLNSIGVLGTAAIGAGYVSERLCTMHIPADIAEKLGIQPKK